MDVVAEWWLTTPEVSGAKQVEGRGSRGAEGTVGVESVEGEEGALLGCRPPLLSDVRDGI